MSPDDEFYASVVDLPKVRYVYFTPLDATKTSEFFYRLGMILSDEEFCSLPRLLPVYEQRLRAWKLPEGLHPEATLIDSGSASQFADIDPLQPGARFHDSRRAARASRWVPRRHSHRHVSQAGRSSCCRRNSSRRPEGSIAPGTVVRDPTSRNHHAQLARVAVEAQRPLYPIESSPLRSQTASASAGTRAE